jgi:hypothetical protein
VEEAGWGLLGLRGAKGLEIGRWNLGGAVGGWGVGCGMGKRQMEEVDGVSDRTGK